MMEATHQRPSDLYYVKSPLVAWCFNRAVFTFGQALENAVREATKATKSEKEAESKALSVLNRWLGSGPNGKELKGRYRDPASSR